ncbi:MAG: alginate lyase family protein [Ignavibacteriales bacterium]|nr:alginate lyase family protein [Ignavibacteriales bacterium]
MNQSGRTFLASLFCVMMLFSFSSGNPKTLILDSKKVKASRTMFAEKKLQGIASFRTFLKEADRLLAIKPLSVMDKSQVPPSGSKHDYLSMGPYWWPDTTKPNGLPYIRRDGERNPEYNAITDPSEISEMIRAVQTLSTAYYITDQASYAAKARTLLHVWFIDEGTKMNPNMNHAQYIPGINTGRGIGIIETHDMYKVLDAIVLLRTSTEWTHTEDQSMIQWFEEYYAWLTSHRYGLDESNEKNNHGSWYDVQVSVLALFLGKEDVAKKILEEAKRKRIGLQIEQDGKQPLELARTKSWGYSNYNLKALLHLALLGDHVGVNLWNYQSATGGSIRRAIEFLLPFVKNPRQWHYTQIDAMHLDDFFLNLHIAKQKYDHKIVSTWNAIVSGQDCPVDFLDSLI